MRLSEKRYFQHCSIRSEKSQRTWDILDTLMKKVCCQLNPCSHTQVRGDPYTNLVRAKNANQVAKRKTKESGCSLKDRRSKFSLKSELRSRSTKFRPILMEEVSRNWMELLSLSETTIRTKSGTSWSSYQKSSWDGRIEESSRVYTRYIFN